MAFSTAARDPTPSWQEILKYQKAKKENPHHSPWDWACHLQTQIAEEATFQQVALWVGFVPYSYLSILETSILAFRSHLWLPLLHSKSWNNALEQKVQDNSELLIEIRQRINAQNHNCLLTFSILWPQKLVEETLSQFDAQKESRIRRKRPNKSGSQSIVQSTHTALSTNAKQFRKIASHHFSVPTRLDVCLGHIKRHCHCPTHHSSKASTKEVSQFIGHGGNVLTKEIAV